MSCIDNLLQLKKIFLFLLLAVVFLPPTFTEAAFAEPIKILLVPGHDNEVWGAQYGNIKEADMNLALARRVYNILKKDQRFEVYITRGADGNYTKEFADYFEKERENIKTFRDAAKERRRQEIAQGEFIERENVPHNDASEKVSIILYGINKWANEKVMDLVLHVHFNDYPRPTKWTKGVYKGFAIYVPEEQMLNSKDSTSLAASIFKELRKKYAISTYEKEKKGIVPDQQLIALGSNGSLPPSVRSILIEYGYIYRFPTKKSRDTAYVNMANYTATGIKNYFFKK